MFDGPIYRTGKEEIYERHSDKPKGKTFLLVSVKVNL
jgi:hypothetical protein